MKTRMRTFPAYRVMVMFMTAAFCFTTVITNATEFDKTQAGYDALLKRFVTDGRVDYQGLKPIPLLCNVILTAPQGFRKQDSTRGRNLSGWRF